MATVSVYEGLAQEDTQGQVAAATQTAADVLAGWSPENPVPGADFTTPFQPIAGDEGEVTVPPGEEVEVVPALPGRAKVIVTMCSDAGMVRLRLAGTAAADSPLPLWAHGHYDDFLNCAINAFNPGPDPVVVTYQGLGA